MLFKSTSHMTWWPAECNISSSGLCASYITNVLYKFWCFVPQLKTSWSCFPRIIIRKLMHVSKVQFHWFKRQNSYFLDKKLKILALVRSPQTAYCGLNHGLRFLRDFTHGKITEVPSHYTQSLPIRNTLIRNDPSTSSIRKRQPIEFFDHEKQIVILTTKQLK